MKYVVLDFETFWDTDYSLSKLSFIEYIKDQRFEIISVSTLDNLGQERCIFGQAEVIKYLQSIDWENTAAIAHNGNEFDFPVLTWVCGCKPKLFIDTLCMSRPIHQSEIGGSLKKLSEIYNLEEKDQTALYATKGKRYMDFTLEEMASMAKYNKRDTANTKALFDIFLPQTPKPELIYSDMTARMICYPQLQADTELMQRTLVKAEEEKEALYDKLRDTLNVLTVDDVKKELRSAKKFAGLLTVRGVEVPRKISKTTGKEIAALSKTDEEFLALAQHEDEEVQMLVAARLNARSTILETRLATMIQCSDLMEGLMPAPLSYHSATTGRWGGRIWNPQNLPRVDRDKKTGAPTGKLTNSLRLALKAPPGYKVVVSDLSNIELRVNHYLWQVPSTAALFAQNPEADLYRSFGGESLFDKAPEALTFDERQLAKIAQLGLGFGSGAKTFRKVAGLPPYNLKLTEQEAADVTAKWRQKYVEIVRGWWTCQRAVGAMFLGAAMPVDPRGLVMTALGYCTLPSGRKLYYPHMTSYINDKNKTEYTYGVGNRVSKIYAGLFDENLVQAIARDVIAEQAATIQAVTGRYPALMVHDELAYVVPEDDAETFQKLIDNIMRTAPKWLPGIVLWSESDIADSYGEAK